MIQMLTYRTLGGPSEVPRAPLVGEDPSGIKKQDSQNSQRRESLESYDGLTAAASPRLTPGFPVKHVKAGWVVGGNGLLVKKNRHTG